MTQARELWSTRYAARCACGYGIECELWLEHGSSTFVVPFDNEETGETYGEQVERCRRCGTRLAIPESLWQYGPLTNPRIGRRSLRGSRLPNAAPARRAPRPDPLWTSAEAR